VVAVSSDVANELARAERIRPERLVTIQNGVDIPSAQATPSFRAICVARLSPLKDMPTLLRATRRIVDREPRFRLEILGDGPERSSIEALRRELSLEAFVELRGEVTDVRARLLGAGLFVLASQSEGISIAILEAMAAGLPVVATRVGGNGEIVVEGGTGYLVEAGDDAGLANATLALLAEPGRAGAMGRAGRARVEECFDLRRVVARYEALYEQTLAGRPSP
jgi:glycosyltransferase involved in cell wall biosynthesis